jgi:hypothetical protein
MSVEKEVFIYIRADIGYMSSWVFVLATFVHVIIMMMVIVMIILVILLKLK